MATKILFFDDEKNIAEIVQKNLALFGFDVILVSTITELFAEIENESITYNLVLMDIMAPKPSKDEEKNKFTPLELSNMSNGIRIGEILVNKIRNISRYADIPILFYSARDNVKTPYNTKHIRKPALAKEIIEGINSLLKGGTK
jgi:CheY-like chemotaxis protein